MAIPQIGRPGANVPGGAPPPQQNGGVPIFGGLANQNQSAPPIPNLAQFGGGQIPLAFPSAPNLAGPQNFGQNQQPVNPLPIPETPNSGPSGGFQVPSIQQPMSSPLSHPQLIVDPFATPSGMPGPYARDPNMPPQPVQFPGVHDVRPVNPPILTNTQMGQVPLRQMSIPMPQGPSIHVPHPGLPGLGEQPGPPKPPPIPQPVQSQPGPVLRFPPLMIVFAFVVFLAVIAEVDSMSKSMGRMTSRYTGASAGSVLRIVIILLCLAGGVVLLGALS
jgi:hypothetical protein